MHFYTLWYPNNPILKKYSENYCQQLYSIVKDIFPQQSFKEISDYLIIPDIAVTIEWYKNRKILEKDAKIFLQDQWSIYATWNKEYLFSSQGSIIAWTDICLTLQDANPDRNYNNHPDHEKDIMGLGFGNIPIKKWQHLYAESFALLHDISPWFLSEISGMISKIIPFGISSSSHNSASYSSCIGHLYMSYPIDIEMPELAVLEAIIHESNHNKLNLIMKSDPLILNTREEVYYSPYRPDARHIQGIYLWVHALVAVIYLFFHAHVSGIFTMNPSWLEKCMMYQMKNALSFRILQKYAILTPLGQKILEEMYEVHRETTENIHSLHFENTLKSRSALKIKEHFQEVQKLYSNLRY